MLAVSFEGQVLYAILDYYEASAGPFVLRAVAAHFVGLIACGIFVRNMRTAKVLILFSIAFCAIATGIFFLHPSFLWTIVLLLASFLVGCCVAAWGFYFKGCTPKTERIKTMADGLIFSNLLMILLNMAAIHISPQTGLGFSLVGLIAAFLFALRLPKEDTLTTATSPPVAGQASVSVGKFSVLAFLCLFIVIITINSGLMYQVVNPAFAHLKWLTSWYWAVPYIATLILMRNLSGKFNRSYILYMAIAWIGFSFIAFLVPGRSWTNYLVVNTLLMGACGVYDLFWWSILGDMLDYDKNPAKIIGIGLAANVFGVLLGELFGAAINTPNDSGQNQTLLAFGVVCATFIMLPLLHKRLMGLLKSHVYLSVPIEIPVQGYTTPAWKWDFSAPLSTRESEVMNLLMLGKTYKAIASELYISENTVGSHARNVYTKAGVTNRAELMNLFMNTPTPPSKME